MNETLTHFEQRLVTQDGITYSFSVANEASDRKAVFVHGVTGAKEDMMIMGRKVATKGYATYLVDLPNHGKSSKIDIQTFDQMGEWLRNAIAAIGIAPDVIIGNSYGSAICYNYAAQGFLPRHTQLILGCPTPDISFMTVLLGKTLIHLPHSMIRPFYNSRAMIETRVAYLSRSRNAQSRKLLRTSEMRKIPYLDVLAATKMGHMMRSHNPFQRARLSEAAQRRTTVVIGDRDNVVTSRSIAKLRRILPYASFDIVRGVGHILHFEAPEHIVQHVGEVQ
jgi:pimeloyl-ACP methyl ester carboxylesterase